MPGALLSVNPPAIWRGPNLVAGNTEFLQQIALFRTCVHLFEHLPDVLFHIKDLEHRYQAANPAFARSIGLRGASQVIGKRPQDLFPPQAAKVFIEQDLSVFSSGLPVLDHLTPILHESQQRWHLTTKFPLIDAKGAIIGLAGIDRNLGTTLESEAGFAGVGRVILHIQQHLDQPLQLPDLARLAGLSATQLERRIHRLFRISTNEFIRRERINRGAILLRTTTRPISQIALACGYGDQSSFTRQFRSVVGIPPAAYRERMREEPGKIATFVDLRDGISLA